MVVGATSTRAELAGGMFWVRKDPLGKEKKDERRAALETLAAQRGARKGKPFASIFRGGDGSEGESGSESERDEDDDVIIIEKPPVKRGQKGKGKGDVGAGGGGFRSAADVIKEMPPPKKQKKAKAAVPKKVCSYGGSCSGKG